MLFQTCRDRNKTLLISTALHIYLVWKIRDFSNYCLLKSSGVDDCIYCNVGCTLNSPLSCLKIKGNASSAIWQRQPGLGPLRPLFGRNRNHSDHFALGTAPYFDLFQKRWETNEVTFKTAWIVLSQRTHQGQHKGKHLWNCIQLEIHTLCELTNTPDLLRTMGSLKPLSSILLGCTLARSNHLFFLSVRGRGSWAHYKPV